MDNNNTDIELLAGLGLDSSEAEILKGIKILQKRLKANHDARFKLDLDIDETVIRNTVEKLQRILNGKELSIDTKESIQAITKEVNAMADIVTVAKKASIEKLEFAKANKKVKESADNTADAINREHSAMNSLDDIDNILNNINMSGQQGNSVFRQFGDTFRDAFSAYSLANLMERALDGVIDAGKEAIETVKELNNESTSLIMATGADKSVVEQYMSDYNALGQELGFITSDISQAADSYLRQGHSVVDTNELIKDSLILAKVSELETAESTEYLTAIMQAYKLKASEVIEVVDRLSSVDLNAAVDAGGIAEAMSKTAVSAQLAGVSIDQLIAMVSTVGEVSQAGMSEVGNAIRTIFARMKDVSDGNLSRIGDDGTIEDLSNIEGTLRAVDIQLRETNNEFRNMFTILDETADKWTEMSSVQKAAVAEAYSGIRQSEKFNILMENWDKVRKYIEVSEQSAGVASEKFDAYLESIESKVNSLKASMENLATTTISDELYISILEVTKGLVDATAETGALKNILVGLGTAGAVYTFQHLASFVGDATQGFANLNEAMDMTRNGSVGITDMQRLIDLTGNLSQSQTRLLLSTNNLTDAQKVAILMNQNMSQAEAENAIQAWNVANAQQSATSATITFSGALKGLWATMKANPLVLITSVVTTAVMLFNKVREAQENAAQELDNIRKELSETASELENISGELDSLNKQIDEILAKDKIEIVDENELKKLREEVDLLEAKKALLEAQEYEKQQETNRIISEKYNKNFTTAITTTSDGSIVETDALSYFEDLYKQAEKYALSENPLTDEDKMNFESIKEGAVELGLQLTDLLEDFMPLTAEEEKQKEAMEAMLRYATQISDMYAGTSYEIGERLIEKFATGTDVNSNKLIVDWINSLTDEEKRIMVQCQLDEASLNDLKAYLAEQTADIEESTDINIKYTFSYDKLDDIPKKLAEVENAYKTAQDALDSYNENGYYSMSVIDSILALEDEYINILVDENGQLQINSDSMNKLASIKIEAAKASIYQETCEELVRIKTLDTALVAQELALINGTLTKSAYETARALYEEVQAMGGANALLAGEVWDSASKKVKLLDNQLKSLSKGAYDVGKATKTSDTSKESSKFDWLETLLSRIQRVISNLDKVVSGTYRKWSTRNNALAQEIQAVNEQISLQQSAYETYMSKANSVGLSDHYKNLVMNGGLSIEDISDDNLKEQIKDFQSFYEKALDASDAIEDLRANIAELAKTKFNNLMSEYDSQIAVIEHHTNMLDEFIAQSESAGYMASQVYYEALSEKQSENIKLLQEEYTSLLSEFDNAVKNNSIEKFSSDWYDMLGDINDVEEALQSATSQLIEYNQAMQQLSWDAFERIQDYTNNINDEANFLIDILDGYDLHNDVGALTDHGLSVQGLHAMNYNVYMEQSAMYADEIAKIEKEIASDPYDTELIDRRNELLELQQETIQNAIKEKESIQSLISDGYDKMLSSLDELIEKRKSALQAEKDLYDYQNSIEEKSTQVSNFKKQIESYKNDTSEAGRATLQKLYVSLESAEKSLEESEYEKYISDQQKLLDTFASDTEQWINQRLDNLDGLVAEAVSATNKNATTISNTINEASSAFGYELSSKMEEIWGRNDSGLNGIKYVVSIYGDVLYGIMQTVDGDINTAREVLAQHIGNSDMLIGAKIDSNGNVVSTSIANGMALINGNFTDIVDGDKTINSSILSSTTTVCSALNGIKDGINSMISELNKMAQSNAQSIASVLNQVIANQSSSSVPTSSASTASNTSNSSNTPSTNTNATPQGNRNQTQTVDRSYIVRDADTGSVYANGLTESEARSWASSHNYEVVGTSGKAVEVRYKGRTQQQETKYKIVDRNGRTIEDNLTQAQANAKNGSLYSGKGYRVQAYASGTDNAQKGFHLVSEEGEEIILTKDGNAVLAKGMQLFPFQGGEVVFDADKTAELLNGSLVPLDASQLWGNVVTTKLPDFSKVGNRNVGNVVNEIHFDVNLSGVQDPNAFIDQLGNALKTNRIEKIVKSISLDELAGRNSLTKYKY